MKDEGPKQLTGLGGMVETVGNHTIVSDFWIFWDVLQNWKIAKLTKLKRKLAPENGWDWKTIWLPFWDTAYFQDFSGAISVFERVFTCSFVTRWVPSSYKWSYNPNK